MGENQFFGHSFVAHKYGFIHLQPQMLNIYGHIRAYRLTWYLLHFEIWVLSLCKSA